MSGRARYPNKIITRVRQRNESRTQRQIMLAQIDMLREQTAGLADWRSVQTTAVSTVFFLLCAAAAGLAAATWWWRS